MERNRSHFGIETRVKDDDVQIAVSRRVEKFGRLVLNNKTVCWVPEELQDDEESRRMTWLMTWEQFAEVMQSRNLSEIIHLSQAAYASASRAGAAIVPHEACFDTSMPKAREKLGLRRRFNIAELSLIRRGYTPVNDDKWIMYFDSIQSELRMYRTWTGHCIFSMKLREDSHGAEITESWVNREPEQYESTDTKHDIEVASWLIDVFLLGREREPPR